MKQYLELLNDVLENGEIKTNRTGVNTLSSFGKSLRFNLLEGFPIITSRKMFWKNPVHEMLWFIKGDSNVKYLHKHNVHIWDEWADENGETGRNYSKQLRSWKTTSKYIDQLQNTIDNILTDPNSRRHIISLWNPAEIDKTVLPPCHGNHIQFYISENKYINCHMLQRSADLVLGTPTNISEYALLLIMIGHLTNYIPKELMITMVDCHIYTNHIPGVKIQLDRDTYDLPKLELKRDVKIINDFKYDDFILNNYKHCDHIKFPVAI